MHQHPHARLCICLVGILGFHKGKKGGGIRNGTEAVLRRWNLHHLRLGQPVGAGLQPATRHLTVILQRVAGPVHREPKDIGYRSLTPGQTPKMGRMSVLSSSGWSMRTEAEVMGSPRTGVTSMVGEGG